MVQTFEMEFMRVLNEVAPLKSKTVHQRPKQLWYGQQLCEQKLIVRNRERKWLKNQSDKTLKAYKHERDRYNNMVTYEKQQNVTGLAQKLYKIVNKIIGEQDQNPFPEVKTDDELAQDITAKVIDADIPNLVMFAPFMPTEIASIISDMNATSCKLQLEFSNKFSLQ